MTFAIRLPPTLYVFIQTGCEACKASEKPLEAWRKQTRYAIPVIKLNVGLKDWEIAGFEPRATPTYLLVANGEPIASHEGVLDTEELDGWVKQATTESAPKDEEEEEDDE